MKNRVKRIPKPHPGAISPKNKQMMEKFRRYAKEGRIEMNPDVVTIIYLSCCGQMIGFFGDGCEEMLEDCISSFSKSIAQRFLIEKMTLEDFNNKDFSSFHDVASCPECKMA